MEDGSTCEEEMIRLAGEKEREEKEEKERADKKEMEENLQKEEQKAVDEEKTEDETPTTAGEKRGKTSGEEEGEPAGKRLRKEGRTEEEDRRSEEEVSSTSLHSTTKPALLEEACSETDLLRLAERAESEEKAAEEEKRASEEDENTDKTSEAVEAAGDTGEEAAAERADSEDMASKLLASGISVSLIKKKKKPAEEAGSPEKSPMKEGEGSRATTPLEVGPNISVTKIQKEKSAEKKLGLSIKSPGELLETPSPRRVSAQLEDLKDSISVSRVQRPGAPPAAAAPRPPHLAPQAAAPHLMFPQFPQAPGLPMGPPGGHGPMGMPGLHPRPGGPALRAPPPLASGPVSEQLAAAAGGLADYMRLGLEELLRELSAQGSPQATIKGLQLEIEKMSWRHGQELQEMKQNVEIMMKDMKGNIEKENQRTIDQFRKAAEVEKQKAIADTKKKQWCANCTKEAIFYCCWNTSYCDYPCQQAHWPSHLTTCSQANGQEDEGAGGGQQQPPETPATKSPAPAPAPHVLTPDQLVSSLSIPMPRGQLMAMPPGFSMAGMQGMAGMRPQFGGMPRAPMGLSIRQGMPGQLTLSRPYFM